MEQVRANGVHDLAVLRAIADVPRHLFVPDAVRHRAYEDNPLPIGAGQTISQPTIQALSIQALGLKGTEKVLEVGTGSGYQTALLARCAGQVFSIERLAPLADRARKALAEAGVGNVSILVGDGTLGWRAYAPYDGMVVAAASPEVPRPLLEQLKPGARLVLPLGTRSEQVLTVVTVTPGGEVERTRVTGAIFVPLLGRHGFQEGGA